MELRTTENKVTQQSVGRLIATLLVLFCDSCKALQVQREVRTAHPDGGRGAGPSLPTDLDRGGLQVMGNSLLLTTSKINRGEIDAVKFPNFITKAVLLFRGRASGGQTCVLVTIATTLHHPQSI
jgi:hypothetical protein